MGDVLSIGFLFMVIPSTAGKEHLPEIRQRSVSRRFLGLLFPLEPFEADWNNKDGDKR